jgi:hypothetical protein
VTEIILSARVKKGSVDPEKDGDGLVVTVPFAIDGLNAESMLLMHKVGKDVVLYVRDKFKTFDDQLVDDRVEKLTARNSTLADLLRETLPLVTPATAGDGLRNQYNVATLAEADAIREQSVADGSPCVVITQLEDQTYTVYVDVAPDPIVAGALDLVSRIRHALGLSDQLGLDEAPPVENPIETVLEEVSDELTAADDATIDALATDTETIADEPATADVNAGSESAPSSEAEESGQIETWLLSGVVGSERPQNLFVKSTAGLCVRDVIMIGDRQGETTEILGISDNNNLTAIVTRGFAPGQRIVAIDHRTETTSFGPSNEAAKHEVPGPSACPDCGETRFESADLTGAIIICQGCGRSDRAGSASVDVASASSSPTSDDWKARLEDSQDDGDKLPVTTGGRRKRA